MKFIPIVLLVTSFAAAQSPLPRYVNLYCHRTANKDVPENTLESLRQAALLGCDVVEVDVRRTLDGKLVLNHDGMLERLTDGVGEVETSYADELELLDAGSWMGDRFQGFKIPSLESALRLAKTLHLKILLDLKDVGLEADTLELLRREDMLDDARFVGEADEIKRANPQPLLDDTVWLDAETTVDQIGAIHSQKKLAIANFSESGHDMDLSAMRAAVAAGVDGINVDYPRLGADAVGRPVEAKISLLISRANLSNPQSRAEAILSLGEYRNFDFSTDLIHWLLNPEEEVSHAAAVVLVRSRPQPTISRLLPALHSQYAATRANAAWAWGFLDANSMPLTPLLHDTNVHVRQEALSSVARLPGDVPMGTLIFLLSDKTPSIRGAAALALARHYPTQAVDKIVAQLQHERSDMASMYEDWKHRGRPPLTEAEKQHIVSYYRCQMQEIKALSILPGLKAANALEQQAFYPDKDFSAMDGVLAALISWNQVATNPLPAIDALNNGDPIVADHAEWMLIQVGPTILPAVRKALTTKTGPALDRIIHILAFQGDTSALPTMRTLRSRNVSQKSLLNWAIAKIEALHPNVVAPGSHTAKLDH